jgi:hypothetical protein
MIRVLFFAAMLILYPAVWMVLLALYVAILLAFALAMLFCATWGWFERRTLERRWRAERRV